jgi:hypothetical protein
MQARRTFVVKDGASASDDWGMGSGRGYVHLRARDGRRVMARVLAEHDATLRLTPSPGEPVLPRRPEPMQVGWMTWSGMVWCGGLYLGWKGLEDSFEVQLLGRPVAAERRRHVRLPVDLDVEVIPGGYDPTPVSGKCVDLSPGGMQVVLPLELDVGDIVRITLSADDGNSLETTARVRPVQPLRARPGDPARAHDQRVEPASGSSRASVARMGEGGFEPPKAEPTGLQPVPFGHSGTPPEKLSLPAPRLGADRAKALRASVR